MIDERVLIEKLEEVKEYKSGCNGVNCSRCKYNLMCLDGEKSYKVAIDKILELIKELAEMEGCVNESYVN